MADKIIQLFEDKENTTKLYPKTVTQAVVDTNSNKNINTILNDVTIQMQNIDNKLKNQAKFAWGTEPGDEKTLHITLPQDIGGQ